MDNLSQDIEKNSEEKEIKPQSPEGKVVDDIKFDEVFDIDKIQEKLQEKLNLNDTETEADSESEPISATELFEISKEKKEEVAEQKEEAPAVSNLPAKSDLNAKKYVLYIDSYNIDYMESLSLNERREVINRVLQEQKDLSEEQKQQQKKKRFLKHLILACITFIICFPIMFIVVNKAMESVLANYQQARENFTKLYKEQGKIKINNNGAP